MRLYAAPLDTRPVGRITSEQIADVLRPIWTVPGHGQGSRLRGAIEQSLRLAGVEPNPAELQRLDRLLPRKAVTIESHPSLPYREMPALMVELAAVPSVQAKALRFLILTGTRSQEAIGAEWNEFDLDAKTWTIPPGRMKMGEAHTVPLSDAVIELLGPRGDGFVFPSTRGSGRLTRTALNKLLPRFKRIDPTQGKPITVHGFRSTMSTWAQDQGFAIEVIDLSLAHKERSRTRRAYLRSDLLPERRKLADAWAAFTSLGHDA